MTASTSASPANGPSARATVSTKRQMNASMGAICGQAALALDGSPLRMCKPLCKTAPVPTEIGGIPISDLGFNNGGGIWSQSINGFSQGCLPASLYSAEAFEVPNGYSLP